MACRLFSTMPGLMSNFPLAKGIITVAISNRPIVVPFIGWLPFAKARMDCNASNASEKSCQLLKRQSTSPVSNSSAKPRRKATLSDNRLAFRRPQSKLFHIVPS